MRQRREELKLLIKENERKRKRVDVRVKGGGEIEELEV